MFRRNRNSDENFRIYAAIERLRREHELQFLTMYSLVLVQTGKFTTQEAMTAAEDMVKTCRQNASIPF